MRNRNFLLVMAFASLLGATAAPPAAFAAEPARVVVTEQDRKEFREVFSQEGGILIQEIIAQFPAEYLAFETKMIEGISAGTMTEEEAGRLGFEFTSGLAPRLYDGWRMAPDADIIASTRLTLDLATRLSQLDHRACAEMLEGGLTVSTALAVAETAGDLFEQNNASMLRLAKTGRAAGIKRAPATEVEIAALIDAYQAAGGDLRWLTGQASGDFAGLSPAGRCASGLIFQKTILRLPPPLAARIVTAE